MTDFQSDFEINHVHVELDMLIDQLHEHVCNGSMQDGFVVSDRIHELTHMDPVLSGKSNCLLSSYHRFKSYLDRCPSGQVHIAKEI